MLTRTTLESIEEVDDLGTPIERSRSRLEADTMTTVRRSSISGRSVPNETKDADTRDFDEISSIHSSPKLSASTAAQLGIMSAAYTIPTIITSNPMVHTASGFSESDRSDASALHYPPEHRRLLVSDATLIYLKLC
jgi:hypothetical protein